MNAKLVRDKIPEIIASKGESANYYIADIEEYKIRLKDKLLEEVEEFINADNKQNLIEEIADILEVIDAILVQCEIDKNEVLQIKNLKKRDRGGFLKKYILKM